MMIAFFFVSIFFSFTIENTIISDLNNLGTVLSDETNLTINHK